MHMPTPPPPPTLCLANGDRPHHRWALPPSLAEVLATELQAHAVGSDGGAENANGIVKGTNSPSKIVNGLNEIESRYNHTGGQERNGYDSGGFFPASLDHPDNNLQRSEQKYVGFLLLYQTDELIN